jgi:hypothetical protein
MPPPDPPGGGNRQPGSPGWRETLLLYILDRALMRRRFYKECANFSNAIRLLSRKETIEGLEKQDCCICHCTDGIRYYKCARVCISNWKPAARVVLGNTV